MALRREAVHREVCGVLCLSWVGMIYGTAELSACLYCRALVCALFPPLLPSLSLLANCARRSDYVVYDIGERSFPSWFPLFFFLPNYSRTPDTC